MHASGNSPETIRTRTDHLRRAARNLNPNPWAVTGPDLITWSGQQTWARETRRSVHNSIRQFYAWAARTGHIDTSPADQLPKIRAAEPQPRPAPAALVDTAIARSDTRTALILRCAIDVGLRRTEIALIHRDDLFRDLAGWSLVVHGKGSRERIVPLPADLATDLAAACLAGQGWAFPGQVDGHISPQWVGKLASRALPGVWTLHTLRHGFATRLNDATGDLLAVQQLLGHASPATTQRYVAVDRGRLRSVVEAGRAA